MTVVTVIRNGIEQFLPKQELVVGDIVNISAGDKITADGILLFSDNL